MLKALRRRGVDRAARGRPFVEAILDTRDWETSPLEGEAGRRLLDQPGDVLVSAVFATLEAATPESNVIGDRTISAGTLASQLARRKLPYTADDVDELFRLALAGEPSWLRGDRLRVAVAAADFHSREHGVRAVERSLRTALKWLDRDQDSVYGSERTALAKRIRKLLETEPPRTLDESLLGSDDWGKRAARLLDPHKHDSDVARLIAHAAGATQSRPSKKWRETAAELADEGVVRSLLEEALAVEDGRPRWGVPQWLSDKSATTIRGLVYTAAVAGYPWVPDLLARLGAHAGATIGQTGEVREMKVANACIRALGDLGGDEAVAALAVLRNQVRHRSILKQVEAALDDAAASAGLTKGHLLERQVPPLGGRDVHLGTSTAILADGELSWLSNGKPVKSVPKHVREEHADELKQLRADAKEMKTRLAVERLRVESLFAEARRWPADEWRRYYGDHPLVGSIARPLLWRFLADGRAEVALGSDAPDWAEEVELWHPIGAEPEEVQRWRRFLLERELTQPFKQVFREVYVVAPAELETRTYSNRFAAHILRYPQAYALVKARGWGVRALGPYDNDGGAQWRDFEHFGLRAHFWMEHADENFHEMDMIAAYASTDQVRFTRIGDDEALPLADVPRIVFSEAMRDVDLFVGVSSIAGDPDWVDRGENRFVDYWRSASFGELSETAETRREVLEELLPQLAIADRCTLTDRYLVVRGDLRTYRIHLGSANILMEPNDEYLCIVPARKRQALYLPFPEDERLAVILSKAFLLARDTKIEDPTIRGQIKRN